MTAFSPSDAALEGFRLTRERPGTVLASAVVNFLGITILGGMMLLTLGGPFVQFVQKGGLANGSPEELVNMLEKSWPAFLILLFVVMLFTSILTAGIYRLVLRPEEKGFAHLRVGRDEWRLTAVNLILFVSAMVCVAFVDLVGNGVTSANGVLAGLVAAGIVAAPLVWAGVRLSLMTPMTFAEHRIDWGAAWSLTRGRFWPLFGMTLLAAIFYVMVWALLLIIYVVIMTLAGGAPVIEDLWAGRFTVRAVIALTAVIALQLILPVLQWVMIFSPLAVAYKQIRGEASAG